MIQKRQVLVNAAIAALQTLINGVVLFLLYRYLLRTIGEQDLGVWALVLATTSAAGLANLGIATSTIKFVSQAMAQNDPLRAIRIIQTSAISVAVILGIVLPLAYPFLHYLLERLIEPAIKIPAGLLILPYALASFWLNALAGVFQGCIDGLHRIDIRGFIVITTTLIYLALVYWLVPLYGLEGLAQAQVIQAALLLIISWFFLRNVMGGLPILPYRWTYQTFRTILGYSLNFQVISISQLLMEPITKALISRFAGVGTLAYFEMAQRMVFQLRALIATAHQAIVPTISALQEQAPDKLAAIYRQSFQLLVFFVLPALPFFIVLTPFISYLWIGAYNAHFILFANLIFVGWFANLLANPAYFANLGTGHLKWNVVGHLVMGALNLVLGLVLGTWYGGTGIVVGFVISILAGSFVIPLAYHQKHGIKTKTLLDRSSLYLGLASVTGMALALILKNYWIEYWSPLTLAFASTVLFCFCIAIPLWRHPLRRQLVAWLETLLTRPASI